MPRLLTTAARWIGVLALAPLAGLLLASGLAGEALPPAPKEYFNDYAHLTDADTARRLNRALEQFEKETSSQLVVAVFPKLEAGAALEDFTVRVFQAWKPGQKGKDNGAILFVFAQDHKVRVEVGYGLEGALTDAMCKRVIEEQITPRFRQGDFRGGLTQGTLALMQAAKGEYKGTGRTVAGNRSRRPGMGALPVVLFFLFVVVASIAGRRRGVVYSGGGHSSWGGWSGGGGGGGFSGGGGSSGGGGASGSW